MADEENVTSQSFPAIQRQFSDSQPILQEWTNHSSFYAVYPKYYYSFANYWLRKWLQWYDGFVPGVHDGRSGILSTRLGTTLCRRLSEQIFGGGLLFQNDKSYKDSKEALEFVSGKLNDEIDLQGSVLKAITLCSAGGTAYIKTNVDGDKKVWIDSYRADQAFADIDYSGKVIKAKFLIAKYTKTVPEKEDQNFYVVEERFYATEYDNKEYKNKYRDKIQILEVAPRLEVGHPYVVYKVYRLQGQVNDFNQSVNIGRELEWAEIPEEQRKSIKQSFGAIKLNIPQKLPFTDLGVDMLKWTSFISNLPQLPFGESALANVQSYLFEYDFMNSCMNTDFYLGRGRVMVPKSLQSPVNRATTGANVFNKGLDDFLFTKVEYASTEDKKPEAIQFDIRSQEWINSRNHLIENIATAMGISPSTLASYLNDSSARTAREISSEESSTALYVENRRRLFIKPLNDLLRRILLFNGYTDCVTIKFSKSGQTNTTLLTENTVSQYNAGLISQYQAVKNLNPDATEEELQAELDRINNERKANEEAQSNLFDTNDFNEDKGIFGGVDETGNNNSEEAGAQLAEYADRRSPNTDQADNQ